MRTHLFRLMALSCVISSGCSMCSRGFLDDYATVGGKWQRSDPAQGRVGSIFSDPGSTVSDGMADNSVVYSNEGDFQQEFFGEAYVEEFPQQTNEFSELDSSVIENDAVGSDSDGVIILGDQW